MSEDPRVTAKKKEVHELLVAKVKAVREVKMRVAQAKIQAVRQAAAAHELSVKIARHLATVTAAHAQAHAAAAEQQIAQAKAAQQHEG